MPEQSEEVKRRIAKRKELQADPELVQQRLSQAIRECNGGFPNKLTPEQVVRWDRGDKEGQLEARQPIEARLEQIEKRLETLEMKR
jgi:hypothetical protein